MNERANFAGPDAGEGAVTESDALGALDRFRNLKVLVYGDFILDRYVDGVIERISPEAPVPVLHGSAEKITLGGAGNVVANVIALGGTAIPVAVLGNDLAGKAVTGLLAELGAYTGAIAVSAERMTSSKSRFRALAQQLLRFDEERIAPLSAADRATAVASFRERLVEADVVILSDYGKGSLLDGVPATLIAACREAGKLVVVDPKGRDYTRYSGATAVSPNRKELGEATDLPVTSDEEVEAAARALIASCGLDFVLATRSEKGMSVVDAGTATHIRAQAREVFDVSGAGDTVVATFALALASGLDRSAAASMANAAAGIVVAKRGTATVGREELVAALFKGQPVTHSARSVVDRATAAGIVSAWKHEGLSVAFTNGCFDILHVGHVSLMQQARATADRLVLGLNSDASVRRLKGSSRPVNNERDRAFLLAAMAAVDLVVVFDEDTPLALIEALRPDVLVKGADYTVETVVGADVVMGYGGRVVLADLMAGKSTTNIIKQSAALAKADE
ncbi:MAG: D-glycero-beta-D-manno-heptose-7-phosphate kinase [Geminicoccaceae bacterium]|nr:D-glycero-beta-D-manno-heptose-7-phosphate kinase [Geminicoccaceae bacterium]